MNGNDERDYAEEAANRAEMRSEQSEAHPTVIPAVEALTDRVLNWYGFTYASDYRLRPDAMKVAVEIYSRESAKRGIYLTAHDFNSLTADDIESADRATGGHITAMWQACQTPKGGKR